MDSLSPTQRSARMAKVRSKDTHPELVVRRIVHAMGYRYRLHKKELTGTPDLVFSSRRKVIFVHGCFWHRHEDPSCRLARLPKSRIEFWTAKLEGNRLRDLTTQDRLESAGWQVMIIWECQLRDVDLLKQKICEFLEE